MSPPAPGSCLATQENGTGSYPGRRRAGSRGPAVVRTERPDSAIASGVGSVGDAAQPLGGTSGFRAPRSVRGAFWRRSRWVSAPEYGRKCPQGVVDGLRIWKDIEEIRCDDDHVGTMCVARCGDAPDGVGEVVLRTHGVLVLGGCASCLAHTVFFRSATLDVR